MTIRHWWFLLALGFLLTGTPAAFGSRASNLLKEAVAYWDFRGVTDREFMRSKGRNQLSLTGSDGRVHRQQINASTSRCVLSFTGSNWYYIDASEVGALNIRGAKAQVTVLAWVRQQNRHSHSPLFVAGMWDEGRKARQYGLFLNLEIYQSSNQVGAHISDTGGPTPGNRFAMEAAIGNTKLPYDQWFFAAMVYNGQTIQSYLNTKLDVRAQLNPYPFDRGIADLGPKNGEFTVGANFVQNSMQNAFTGDLAFLAVYDRALTPEEMKKIASASIPDGARLGR